MHINERLHVGSNTQERSIRLWMREKKSRITYVLRKPEAPDVLPAQWSAIWLRFAFEANGWLKLAGYI